MSFFRRRRERGEAGSPADVYVGLRQQVLNLTAADLGADPESTPVLAVLMETGCREAVATLVGVVDGTTSLYFSDGGGTIGAGEHAEVAGATRRWLGVCEGLLELLRPCGAEPEPPSEGVTQFVAVTADGLRCCSTPEVDLGEGRHDLTPLFYAGQDVITQVRLRS